MINDKTRIDLHMHTTHSDGSLSVSELLELCESAGLGIISITDHDNVNAYQIDLRDPEIRAKFSGKIINGVELTCLCLGMPIEILGYGINPEKIAPLINTMSLAQRKRLRIEIILKKLSDAGFKVKSADNFQNWCECYQYICQNFREFLDSLDPMLATSQNYFFRRGVNNRDSFFGVDYSGVLPDCVSAIDLIRECGGRAFLAHPAQYQPNAQTILDFLVDKVDGLECFHYSASDEYSRYLQELCKQHGLLMSGGSDFHGDLHPEIFVGTGTDNRLYITKDLLACWGNKC